MSESKKHVGKALRPTVVHPPAPCTKELLGRHDHLALGFRVPGV